MRRRRADAGYDPRATRPLRNVRRHRRQTARLRRDTTLRRRESREHSCGRYVSRSNQSASRAKNSAVKDWCRGHFQTFQRIPKRDLARSRGPARTGSAHAKAASRDPHRRRLHRRHLRDRLLLAKSRSRPLKSCRRLRCRIRGRFLCRCMNTPATRIVWSSATRRRSRPQTAKCQSDRATVLFPANSTRTLVMQVRPLDIDCSDSVRIRIGRCSCVLSLSASSPSGCVAYAYHNELDIGPNETPAFIS